MARSTRVQAFVWVLITAGVALGCGHLLRSSQWDPAMRLVLSLAPALAMARFCMLAVRIIRDFDELESRIQLEGALYGLLSTAIITMSGGLLMKAGVIASASLADVWPWLWIAAFLTWGLGSIVAGHRYR